ncbi:FkbM family methyltransferase [Bradyrhizobium sp. 147]|uniref:FkbM family methyltransferase n=1 Tax=unclassified Bradyrhizobium TaxID=2631580 RepID=UPI001FF90A10|nr:MULTISPECIES: FkbM family methyltransferase [unclassified Bradyrhizobium]MCK1546405.1 FkbM family methyltransferase [Bradyrhizobium sp. 179]MCK1625489.1 FkbM family methyltransferase [Bradyrhizobium sp. 160]MCK1680083.1 FkbM family methyltransferase [Bradyrhizobium sp. 147]MCK1757350.1 FkbM family methyltransferase [Bradyrhizobium sp. 137]
MIGLLKDYVKARLLDNDFMISGTSKEEELKEFFRDLFPVVTDKKLIRLGGSADGGYLVPDDLDGCVGCFSPGVYNVSDFELGLAERGIPCFLADFSVDAPAIRNDLLDFEKKFLGNENNAKFMTLENWMSRKGPRTGDLILQMDIEGGEYEVLIETSCDDLKRFRIMIIEFHSMDRILNPIGLKLIGAVFKKITKHFDVVHIHPNNYFKPIEYREFKVPPIMEFSFLRKDRVSRRTPARRFPHDLDRRNVANRDDVVLPKCWFAPE